MRIVMIGGGYVGLVSAACFAEFGHTVFCCETDSKRIHLLNSGGIPFFEPGLEDLVARGVNANRLFFNEVTPDIIAQADVVFLAVGTPSRRGDGHADMQYVFQAVETLAPLLPKRAVVVTKSTVPVGTGDSIAEKFSILCPEKQVDVVSNPEFLREGSAINDFKHPDRIVIGTESPHARQIMSEVYRPLSLRQAPCVFTTRRTAELIKYATNAFLALKVTYINEISNLCEKLGTNVQEVADTLGLDNRIGHKFLHPGPGYGGSCFPKDTRALILMAQECGAPVQLVETAVMVNEMRADLMVEKIRKALGGTLKGCKIAGLGVTFKPNTDDVRESPALAVWRRLENVGAEVCLYDPHGLGHIPQILPNAICCSDAYACAQEADALVIATEWEEFRALDMTRIKHLLRNPCVIDLRNIYDPQTMRDYGFHYVSVGRPSKRLEEKVAAV
jgi:UDPglucose 6-dehydrogenase